MGKIYCFIIMMALAVSCSKSVESGHDLQKAIGGVISLSSEISLENEPGVKAEAGEQALHYVVEAWTVGKNSVCAFRREFEGSSVDAKTEIMLVPGEYDLLFWADYGNGNYNTENLTKVSRIIPHQGVVSVSPDAFAAVLRKVYWNGKGIVDVKLVRPVSKLTVLGKEKFTESKEVKITYTNLPAVYNVRTEVSSVVDTGNSITVSYPKTSAGKDVAAEDFLFVPSGANPKVGMTIIVGNVEKSLDELPLKPNYKVNVTVTL